MLYRARDRRVMALFKEACEGVNGPEDRVMTKMRGSVKSVTLMIAPPPSLGDYKEGLPFSDERGKEIHDLFLEFGIDSEEKFLIVAASLYGEKPNKASTRPVVEFVAACGKEQLFRRYVCMGDNAFKFIFGGGRKTPMQTLSGSITYLPELGHLPLFTFPPLGGLCPTFTGEKKTDYILGRIHEDTLAKLRSLMPKFKTFMKVT